MTGSLTWAALANLAKIAAASESSSRDEADDRLGRVAVMRGYLGALELQDVRGGRPKAWLGDLLVRAGWLSPDQLLALLETLKPDWTACWRCRAEVVASLCGPCVEAVKALAVDEPKSLGKYEIVRKIGSGGMGSVYEAIDPQLNRKVALKLLHAGEGADHRLIERFRREAQNAARLQHSNIVTVYEAGEAGRTSYIAMELVDGVPLSVWRARERPSLREAVRVIEEAARAVQAAHDKGIIHRDLKPANILVDRHGRPHLLDFGLSHAMDTDHGMTRPGTILGTPLYMPPEQVRGDVRQMDARSDVYALGAVLYEVLTGRPPFQEASAIEIYTKILTHEATPPRRIDKTVPRDLETVALRALEKDPERRYATAGALADDLHRWSEDEPIEARPVSRIERLVRKAVRYRAILLPSSAALIVGLLVGILGLSSLKKNGRLGDDVSALPPLVEGHGVGWKLSFTINDRVVYPELVNGVWRHEAITARVVDERFVLEGEGPISEVRWLARADFPSNAQLIVIGHAGENLTARLPIQSNGMAVIGDVLVGFATSETGYNRVRARSGQVELSSSLGRYLLESGRTLVLDRLWIARGKPEELLARYAERWMVQSAGPPRGWDSWHAGGWDVTEEVILANADAARNLGLEYVEIDLGYPSLSDDPWETNERFPHGHRWLTEQIRCMGLKPGLCIAPWTVPRVSEPFRRGWVFKGDDGAPQPMNMDYPGERWGETYCLDPSIPDACAWLKELGRRISQEWGYEYVKLDHLWQILGARRLGVNMTSMQAYRNGLAALRAGVGEKTLLIGSRADRGTYLPAADFLDGMKMREALGPDWASFLAAVDATAARWWLNGRAWWNHSGPLFVHEPLSLDEARTWASYVAVRGEAFMMGGDVPRLPPERLEVVRKALALRAEDARPVGLFAEDALDPSVWRARRGDGEVVLIMNVGLSDRAYSVPLGGRFRVSEEWSGQNLGEVDRIVWTLKPHACAVFLLSVSDR